MIRRTLGAERAATTAPSPRRRVAVAAVGLAATLGLSACQWTSTVQTDKGYEPADGSSTTVGSVELRNVLVVSGQQGGRGNVVGLAVNGSDSPAEVSIGQVGGRPSSVTIPARGSEQLSSSGGKAITLDRVDAAPGALTTLQVSAPGGSTDLSVPIMKPQGYYSTLAPSAPAPAPSSGQPAQSGQPTQGGQQQPTQGGQPTPSGQPTQGGQQQPTQSAQPTPTNTGN